MRPGSLFPKGAETRAALRSRGILTVAGAIGLIPAAILVVTGLLGIRQPKALVLPIVVMGGLAVSIGSSFVAVTHWDISDEAGLFRLTCLIRKRVADLAIFCAGVALLLTILVYSFLENFQPR